MTDDNISPDAVVIERGFDAPVELIWQMWTDPEHFTAWYGPDGASVPVAKMDVRVGGTRLVCMEVQTPDGPMQMWFTGEYREVSENERLGEFVDGRRTLGKTRHDRSSRRIGQRGEGLAEPVLVGRGRHGRSWFP